MQIKQVCLGGIWLALSLCSGVCFAQQTILRVERRNDAAYFNMTPSIRPRKNSSGGTYNLQPSIQTQKLVLTITPAIAGETFVVTILGDNSAAGHVGNQHDPSDVHGWLALPGEQFVDDDGLTIDTKTTVAPDALGGSVLDSGNKNHSQFTITTDQNGKARFTYIAPEVAALDTLNASDIAGFYPDTSATLQTAVTGLTAMTTVTSFLFKLYGVTASHPRNWFVASTTVTALATATTTYQTGQTNDTRLQNAIKQLATYGYDFRDDEPHGTYPGGIIVPKTPEILFINDISLPQGGLFDVGADYSASAGHGGHRDGKQCDIDSKHLVGQTAPYIITNSAKGTATAVSTSIGDTRLESAQTPFTNKNYYVDSSGKKTYYTNAIRATMDQYVHTIHHERLVLLLSALGSAGGSFASEQNHIHVKFP